MSHFYFLNSMSSFIKRHKFLSISFLTIILLIPVLVFAYNSRLEGYRVPADQILYSVSYTSSNGYAAASMVAIQNNSPKDHFVPTKTWSEWSSFLTGKPSELSVNEYCGGGVCETATENCSNCQIDCGSCATCGNGTCDNYRSLECYNSSEACPVSSNYYCSINISGGYPTGNYSHCSSNCTSGYCESVLSCPSDCPPCGDGFCNYSTGENNSNCSADCLPFCGDGICNGSETSSSCILDCKNLPILPPACGDGLCDPGETPVTCPADCPLMACNGNGVCEYDLGETNSNCPEDCPTSFICGDGICSCPLCTIDEIDCPPCEDLISCPQDCAAPPPVFCGDGICAIEERGSCYQDCGFPELPIPQ